MKKRSSNSRRRFILGSVGLLPVLDASARGEKCRPTEPNGAGPFYRKGAPWRTSLCGPDEPGEPLTVSGTIIDADTCKPLKGATVDVWQANAAGRYDNDDPGNPPDPDKFLLRGQMKTDAQGRYRFNTILPANYAMGRAMRAKHIHYIVSCPGYEPLTTQCYFEGDQFNDKDPLVRKSLIVELAQKVDPKSKKRQLAAEFNVVLKKA